MTNLKSWTKLPTGWIQHEQGLKSFKWSAKAEVDNAGQIAALMLLVVLAHHTNKETGLARLSYDAMSEISGISRTLVSRGLNELEAREIITRDPKQIRGTITLTKATENSGWGKLPASGLYRNGCIFAFDTFKLRNPIELDALKLYFLIVALRDNKTNRAYISYEKIREHTGIAQNSIRRAISILAANSLVSVNHVSSVNSEYGYANEFHLPHVRDSQENIAERGVAMPPQGMIDSA
ncbi:MAG: helix-turn-helix domain-containing protein [Hyphomicrobiales bacterium]